jgi:hypothetical protein
MPVVLTDDQVKDEIQNSSGPLYAAYQEAVTAGSSAMLCDAINSRSRPGAGLIDRVQVDIRDPAVRSMLIYAWVQVRNSTDAKLGQDYNTLITLISAVGVIDPSDPNVVAAMLQAQTDGIVTDTVLGPVLKRIGSRAEVLAGDGGDGTIVPMDQVNRVLARLSS